jgi:hypothetical protein
MTNNGNTTKLRVLIAAMLGLSVLGPFPGWSAVKAAAKEPLTIPRLDKAPKIDGVLDDPAWAAQALKLDQYVQLSPKENGVPTMKTTTWIGFDDKNIYFAFRCDDPEAAKIRTSVTNRDNSMDDDWIVVFLDTFGEKRRAFTFIANPIGVQNDFIRMEEGGNDNMDPSWDTAWDSDGKVDDKGYSVEMAIPFKSLRFPDQEKKVWGLTLGRSVPRSGEIMLWPSYSRDIPGLIQQSNEIILNGHVERGNNLEIMPVVTALKRQGEKVDVQPGINLKYGLKSDLTLDATINPDFSHIEADAPQIDVNLRYALRYQEKRPFFLEGMDIFRYPEIEMVYTRRIIDPLWGAKVSGKLGPVTYGLLSAYDRSPSESLWDVHDGGETTNDKTALFNIARFKADVFKNSYLGFSLADKEINGSWNRVAGVDGQFRFVDKWFFSFQAMASKTREEEDTTALAPAVYAEGYYFTKNFSFGAGLKAIHPDFEASSGFVNRTDYRSAYAFSNLRFYPDKKFLNQIEFGLQAGQRDSYFGNAVQDQWLRLNSRLRFTEFNQLFITAERAMERFADIDFHRTTVTLEGQSNIVKWMPFYLYGQVGDMINYDSEDAFLGWGVSGGIGVNFKPSNRIQLGLDYSKSVFWQKHGSEMLWDFNALRTRLTYQLTKQLSLRTIVDYNHFDKEFFGSFLVSYILEPGTVLFVGYDSNYDQNMRGRYDRRNYNIFVKFSYWLRI